MYTTYTCIYTTAAPALRYKYDTHTHPTHDNIFAKYTSEAVYTIRLYVVVLDNLMFCAHESFGTLRRRQTRARVHERCYAKRVVKQRNNYRRDSPSRSCADEVRNDGTTCPTDEDDDRPSNAAAAPATDRIII